MSVSCSVAVAPAASLLVALEAALHGVTGWPEQGKPRFALAYSGGMDSRFLAHAVRHLGFEPLLLMAVGPHVPPEEEAFGTEWAVKRGLELRKIAVDPLALPLVATGDRRRCYDCKRAMFTRLLEEVRRENAQTRGAAPLRLCDGTNASDLEAHRPGMQAVRELRIFSPLARVGLTKEAIYALAELTGMEHPRQKPRPCLLTRLPYGMAPTVELLAALAAGEEAVRRALAEQGQPDVEFRLRVVPGEGGSQRLELHLNEAGFAKLSPELLRTLPHRISKAAPALALPAAVVPQAALSGFFDRQQPVTDQQERT